MGHTLREEKLFNDSNFFSFQITEIRQQSVAIPDKPPPPYTPPSSPRAVRPKPAVQEIPKHVPSSKSELVTLIPGMLKSLLALRPRIRARIGNRSGLDISDDAADVAVAANFGPSRQKFVSFLFDLVADIVDKIFRCDMESQNPAWLPQKPIEKEKRSLPKTAAELLSCVTKEVLVAFNYEKRAAKENLVVRYTSYFIFLLALPFWERE